jgi:hypothetical protein
MHSWCLQVWVWARVACHSPPHSYPAAPLLHRRMSVQAAAAEERQQAQWQHPGGFRHLLPAVCEACARVATLCVRL